MYCDWQMSRYCDVTESGIDMAEESQVLTLGAARYYSFAPSIERF